MNRAYVKAGFTVTGDWHEDGEDWIGMQISGSLNPSRS